MPPPFANSSFTASKKPEYKNELSLPTAKQDKGSHVPRRIISCEFSFPFSQGGRGSADRAGNNRNGDMHIRRGDGSLLLCCSTRIIRFSR